MKKTLDYFRFAMSGGHKLNYRPQPDPGFFKRHEKWGRCSDAQKNPTALLYRRHLSLCTVMIRFFARFEVDQLNISALL